ncbi:MAG: hypothetical protein HQK49_19615 [Oligoflexia bacterium]|nr:hypothetical protein [Oligoflexia bacterium]
MFFNNSELSEIVCSMNEDGISKELREASWKMIKDIYPIITQPGLHVIVSSSVEFAPLISGIVSNYIRESNNSVHIGGMDYYHPDEFLTELLAINLGIAPTKINMDLDLKYRIYHLICSSKNRISFENSGANLPINLNVIGNNVDDYLNCHGNNCDLLIIGPKVEVENKTIEEALVTIRKSGIDMELPILLCLEMNSLGSALTGSTITDNELPFYDKIGDKIDSLFIVRSCNLQPPFINISELYVGQKIAGDFKRPYYYRFYS